MQKYLNRVLMKMINSENVILVIIYHRIISLQIQKYLRVKIFPIIKIKLTIDLLKCLMCQIIYRSIHQNVYLIYRRSKMNSPRSSK